MDKVAIWLSVLRPKPTASQPVAALAPRPAKVPFPAQLGKAKLQPLSHPERVLKWMAASIEATRYLFG